MMIIFCADPLASKQIDSMYQPEADAVASLAIGYSLIDFEALVAGQFQQAVKRVPRQDEVQEAVFRGWMLKPDQYQGLYAALLERGIRLINDPVMYRHTHYLPESYGVIENWTARSVWVPVTENL